jgi:sulfur carrier protein ThiS
VAGHNLEVHVRIVGAVRRYLPDAGEHLEIELPDETTVATLLAQLGLDERRVWLVTVAHKDGRRTRRVKWDYRLSDGDRITLLPFVGGG